MRLEATFGDALAANRPRLPRTVVAQHLLLLELPYGARKGEGAERGVGYADFPKTIPDSLRLCHIDNCVLWRGNSDFVFFKCRHLLPQDFRNLCRAKPVHASLGLSQSCVHTEGPKLGLMIDDGMG